MAGDARREALGALVGAFGIDLSDRTHTTTRAVMEGALPCMRFAAVSSYGGEPGVSLFSEIDYAHGHLRRVAMRRTPLGIYDLDDDGRGVG